MLKIKYKILWRDSNCRIKVNDDKRNIKLYLSHLDRLLFSHEKRLHIVKCHETNVKENKKYKNLYIQFN